MAEAEASGNQVEEIEYLLRNVAKIVRQRGREILSHFDITPPQFDALVCLLRSGSLTMGELCQELFLASSTVTDLVDRMEKNELVQRVRDPEDRRVVRLVVRDKGRDVWQEVMGRRKAYLSGILEHASSAEREMLLSSLSRVYQLMTASDAAAPAREGR